MRGHFVTKVKAFDPDISDNFSLQYKIYEGNELQTYDIDKSTGVITLKNKGNFAEKLPKVLKVSVTDGTFTTFTIVTLNFNNENMHSPFFPQDVFEAQIRENDMPEQHVLTVSL